MKTNNTLTRQEALRHFYNYWYYQDYIIDPIIEAS